MEVRKGYKKTDIGIIPEDWDVKKLGDVGDSIIGLTYKPSNIKDDGVLVLRSSNISNGRLCFDDNVYVDTKIPERIIVKYGDILICVRNGSRSLIGKCAFLDERVTGQSFGAFMSVFRTSYSKFIFFQFQSDIIKRQINDHLGATINQITNKSLNSFKIPFPRSLIERKRVTTSLKETDTLIEQLEKLIAKKQ